MMTMEKRTDFKKGNNSTDNEYNQRIQALYPHKNLYNPFISIDISAGLFINL